MGYGVINKIPNECAHFCLKKWLVASLISLPVRSVCNHFRVINNLWLQGTPRFYEQTNILVSGPLLFQTIRTVRHLVLQVITGSLRGYNWFKELFIKQLWSACVLRNLLFYTAQLSGVPKYSLQNRVKIEHWAQLELNLFPLIVQSVPSLDFSNLKYTSLLLSKNGKLLPSFN